MQVVSVRDAKAEAFGRPFFVTSIGQAIRSFDDEVNRKDNENVLNNHPEDFILFHIGTFDDQTGELKSIMPKILVNGNEVKKNIMDSKQISIIK